jgi:hypothetical protein
MTFPNPRHATTIGAFLWFVFLGVLTAVPAQEAGNPLAVSSRRVELLGKLVADYMADPSHKGTDAQAAAAVLGQFARLEPDCPTGSIAAKVVTEQDVLDIVHRTVAQLVAAKYPGLDEAQLKTEAQARYPIYRKGDLIEFYYATNPQIIRKVRGVYGGRTRTMVLVGSVGVQLEDIARVKGNDELLDRFEPEKSAELRQAFIEERQAAYATEKRAYEEQVSTATLKKETERAQQANQDHGYLYVENDWTTARELALDLVVAERARLAEEARLAIEAKQAEKQRRLSAAAERQAQHERTIDDAMYTDVDARYAAYQERLGAAPVEPPAPVEPVEPEFVAPTVPETTPETTPVVTVVEPEAPAAAPAFVPLWAIIVGAVALLLGIGVAVVVVRRRAAGPGNELKKFFQGRGKVQRTFWQMAEEKPDTFKYVAYRYPTGEEARQALLQLSYVNERVGGDLVCRHDILFGYGPHQDKFVCFVGGENLHYALWREASAVFPEYPLAEYFRVSTAPDVNLEIPNLDSLLADPELQVEHVENREGEGTDYSQYYIYKAPGKDNALEFLKHATVQEAGLHVIVLTQEGVFGKDENGIYEEAVDVWAERYPEHFVG